MFDIGFYPSTGSGSNFPRSQYSVSSFPRFSLSVIPPSLHLSVLLPSVRQQPVLSGIHLDFEGYNHFDGMFHLLLNDFFYNVGF